MPKRTPPVHKPKKRPGKPAHTTPSVTGDPVFAQPLPSPDPTGFKDPVTDQNDTEIASAEPVPQAAGNAVEPILTLSLIHISLCASVR